MLRPKDTCMEVRSVPTTKVKLCSRAKDLSDSACNPQCCGINPKVVLTLENQTVGELLARKADDTPPPAQRALRRAARRAFLWGVEVAELARGGNSLTELSGVGPYIEKLIRQWLDNPPSKIRPIPLPAGFLTLCQARRILA